MGQGAPTAPIPFGKYLLDREIARGGMARVWLGRLRGQGGFEKRLVVKQILPHLADDPRFKDTPEGLKTKGITDFQLHYAITTLKRTGGSQLAKGK